MGNNNYCAICTYFYAGDVHIKPIFNTSKEEAVAFVNNFLNYYLPDEELEVLNTEKDFNHLEHEWGDDFDLAKVVVQLYNLDEE